MKNLNLHSLLSDRFARAIYAAYPALKDSDEKLPMEIAQTAQQQFGHYQCNSAMKLAKPLKLPPRQIAEAIVKQLQALAEDNLIGKLEIAGPGFINITLDNEYMSKRVDEILRSPYLGIARPEKPQRIIVDLASPNAAKELHVGHLRSAIIGDSIARLFEFLGHDVLRLNHIGDWGTSFGMLIAYMKECAPEVLKGKATSDLTHLVTWYRASKKRFDEDPAFKKAAQLEVVALQGGDADSLKAWNIVCEISRKAHQEIYDLLDVKVIERGESFYNPMLADLVADLEFKGLITVSGGAKCVFLEGFENREGETLPLMVQKTDGGYTYDTTDLAAIRHRIEIEKADRIIYVVDAGQSSHFQMVFKAAEKAGYLNPKKVQAHHVPFGLVLGQDGKKFRTRAGETERLIDLLQAAITHADQLLKERSPELTAQERSQLAHALGIGAIKYADLSSNRTGDYLFSYDRMLRFEGNTAAFLMYSYVRILSIKRKINADVEGVKKKAHILLEHPSEIALGIHLAQFSEALDEMAAGLLPNRLTDYLYGLSEKFNAFFRDCRVEGSPQQDSRLLLCDLVASTMRQGLELLGVPLVDKM